MALLDTTLRASLATKGNTLEVNATPVYAGAPSGSAETVYEIVATDSAASLQTGTAPVNALTGLNAVSVTLKLSPGATLGDNWIAMAWAQESGMLDTMSANIAGAVSALAVTAAARDGGQFYSNVTFLDKTATLTIYPSDENEVIKEVAFKNKTATAVDLLISVVVREK